MNKSWKICKLFVTEIHVHVLSPIYFFITCIIYLQLVLTDTANFGWYILLIILYNIILWECILIHELGHCLAGYLMRGHTDKVLLWPFSSASVFFVFQYNFCLALLFVHIITKNKIISDLQQ